MLIKKRIRVLIIDDSYIFRETLENGLNKDEGIDVVGTAVDPYDARDKILELEPDVLTLDVEMPKMSGIKFLEKLMPQYPLPVVVVSSVSSNVFDALSAGAVDFVTKSSFTTPNAVETLLNELIIKIKIAYSAKVGKIRMAHSNKIINENLKMDSKDIIVAIGASTGGTEAIETILKSLPSNIPPTVIVQHMPPVFTKMYAERLNNNCSMEIKEAENGDRLVNGRVLIAPGDYHMRINKDNNGYFVECFKGERVNGHCPSVDVLFDSVAKEIKDKAVGIILTGMGYDGAKGLVNMRKTGCHTIGQDEQSCVVYGMPKVAYDLGGIENQVSLDNIASTLCSILK